MSTVRFTLQVVALLLVPMLVYCAVVSGNGSLTLSYLAQWAMGNYLYMAMPHYLVLAVFFLASLRRQTLIAMLASLNVWLIVFQAWVWSYVPLGESGLVWIAYPPSSALCLCVVACVFLYKRKRRAKVSLR